MSKTKPKGGKAFLVIGSTGMGKTSFMKKALLQVHRETIFLHDVNAEYGEIYDKPFLPSFDLFAEQAKLKKHMVIVYEEATVFLSNHGSNRDLKEVLVGKRHNHNTIFLIFHSLRAVPKYLFDLCNYVVLHKTNDALSVVEAFENDNLTAGFIEIKNSAMIENEYGAMVSPHKIISLL